jgi:hypothetical protein
MNNKVKTTIKASSLAIMLAAVFFSPASEAQVLTLSDGNSSAMVSVNSDAGMSQWLVDGVNNLNQQWFWYRVGSGPQAGINNISAASYTQSSANSLITSYANGSYGVDINYTLTGGAAGSGSADVGEGIKIHNFTATTLNFTFYQYSHFNLLGTTGDSVIMNSSQAYQYKGGAGIAEGIVAPDANEFEANLAGGAGSTLSKLNTVNGLTLNNNDQAGPGDVTWAFEWDLSIAPNSDTIITKDKLLNIEVVPEPATWKIVAIAFAALLIFRSLSFLKQARSH